MAFYTIFSQRSLCRDRKIHPTVSQTIYLRSILILSYYICLCLQSGSFLQVFPTKILHASLLSLILTTCLSVIKTLSLYVSPFLPQNVLTGSGAQPAFYSMGTGIVFGEGKEAGA